MPVRFENYSNLLQRNGKHFFFPSERGRRIGEDIKQRVENAYRFDDFYYHLRRGGHVEALHAHRANTYFCKIDLENFFYSVARIRVVRALRSIEIPRATHYGKWSCVKNPYDGPSYALPYGFVQSPILATLVLATSEIGCTLHRFAENLTVSVYVDDILLSSNDPQLLQARFKELLQAVDNAGFSVNANKRIAPRRDMTVFNCILRNGETIVTPDRAEEFYRMPRSAESRAGFERYLSGIRCGNVLDSCPQK